MLIRVLRMQVCSTALTGRPQDPLPDHPTTPSCLLCMVQDHNDLATRWVQLKTPAFPKVCNWVVVCRRNNDRYHARRLVNFHY